MVNLLVNETAQCIRTFLNDVLPSIDNNWWVKRVANMLSFQQQQRIKENNIQSLSGLDLSALLRVLDKNWFEITSKISLPREARNWIKEMQAIRNRWAHMSAETSKHEDIYRDLDTMQRFFESIKADNNLINKIRELKQSYLKVPINTSDNKINSNSKPIPEPTEFNIGNIVILKATPAINGAVINIIPGKPENRYIVFHNGSTATYYASQLIKKQETSPAKEIVNIKAFHSYLSSLQLRHPGLASLYSLHAARINFVPYQYKPALKLIHSDRPRLLIADEVGVGKTIEAGLILRELQARGDINSVLIICPKPLVTERKWQIEMRRFDEDFEHLDGKTLRYCVNETDKNGDWPNKYSKCILPFSLFGEEFIFGEPAIDKRRRKLGLIDLDPLPHFDLVIVDEAHHLRNTSTYVHQGVRFFCSNAEAVIFLTATPIQLGSDDLFVLLNLLRPDLILDRNSFEHMAEPNPHINRAVEAARRAIPGWQKNAIEGLRAAVETSWGKAILQDNPDFQKLYDQISEKELSPEERVMFVRETEQLHTFSNLINRTRRRDIGKFTTRKPETVTVNFTQEQKELHDKILYIQQRILDRIHGNQNIVFMMSTIRRQVASCLYGLAPFLRDILNRRINEIELEETVDVPNNIGGQSLETIESEIKEILKIAENLDPYDPKLEALLKIVKEKEVMSNDKILLFSSFRHTLKYIQQHLISKGVKVGLIHGDTPDADRLELRRRFRLLKESDEAISILLSSEVGCEGLDYEFCDCLVNYDLPWNPMRVEQRIGRIDRYGQKSETVIIYNLITPGTVDADIYERCLWRIGVFHNALGGSEEILGRITTEIHEVAENMNLTSEELCLRLQQLADNDIRLLREQSELEEKQVELLGIRIPAQYTEQEIKRTSNYWLSATALQNLISHYLEKVCGQGQEYILGDKQLKTLRLNQEARNCLLEDYNNLNRKASTLNRDWEKWLKGNNPHLQITFDSVYAEDNREVTFIIPIHPLVMQAAQTYGLEQVVYTAFKSTDPGIPPGRYHFAIYKWQKIGIREDVVLQPVFSEPAMGDKFHSLIEKATEVDLSEITMPEQSDFDNLDKQHHSLWTLARNEHQNHNYQLAQFRKESLIGSHKARINILTDQLNSATDDKISRMKQSEINRAEADFQRRITEIQKAEIQADISAQPVAFGVIIVE